MLLSFFWLLGNSSCPGGECPTGHNRNGNGDCEFEGCPAGFVLDVSKNVCEASSSHGTNKAANPPDCPIGYSRSQPGDDCKFQGWCPPEHRLDATKKICEKFSCNDDQKIFGDQCVPIDLNEQLVIAVWDTDDEDRVVKLLKKIGNTTQITDYLNNGSGKWLLAAAIERAHLKVAKKLLENHADPNVKLDYSMELAGRKRLITPHKLMNCDSTRGGTPRHLLALVNENVYPELEKAQKKYEALHLLLDSGAEFAGFNDWVCNDKIHDLGEGLLERVVISVILKPTEELVEKAELVKKLMAVNCGKSQTKTSCSRGASEIVLGIDKGLKPHHLHLKEADAPARINGLYPFIKIVLEQSYTADGLKLVYRHVLGILEYAKGSDPFREKKNYNLIAKLYFYAACKLLEKGADATAGSHFSNLTLNQLFEYYRNDVGDLRTSVDINLTGSGGKCNPPIPESAFTTP